MELLKSVGMGMVVWGIGENILVTSFHCENEMYIPVLGVGCLSCVLIFSSIINSDKNLLSYVIAVYFILRVSGDTLLRAKPFFNSVLE